MSMGYTKALTVDSDPTFASNSNTIVPSQSAVKTAVDAINGSINSNINVANGAYVKTALNATGAAPIYACRAWVILNGQTNAIIGSGNVSSITDGGSGIYTVNFTTALPDANYVCSACSDGLTGDTGVSITIKNRGTAQTASTFPFITKLTHTTGVYEPPYCSLAFFR